MTFYRWAMRNGASILFVASLLIFVVSFAASFFLYGTHLGRALDAEGMTETKVTAFTNFWGALAQAASSSVWSFLGACLLYRFDRHWRRDEGPRG
jgi:hypothetical protein